MDNKNITIGILGGGQLAKMLAIKAIEMGLKPIFWIDQSEAIVKNLGDCYQSSQDNFQGFCKKCDKIIFEHEHVAQEYLIQIQESFQEKCQALELLLIAKDRLLEKQLLEKLDIPAAPKVSLESIDSNDLPIIIKQREGGYDGRGQLIISDPQNLDKEVKNIDLNKIIAEKFVNFTQECSLVCVQNQHQEFMAYDLTQNHNKNGMLSVSKNIQESLLYSQAFEYCKKIAQATNYVGVFAVEFFVTQDNQLLVNEISPRVHNSGHWTMDGAFCCQFANHLRATLDMALGSTKSHSKIKMTNITSLQQLENIYKLKQNSKVYLYGKAPRESRKMGHVNEII